MSDEMVRLSKIMSERGLCSRREADELIEKGLVFVNGERVEELGVKFPREVDIQISSRGKKHLAKKQTIILNKPIGYVSHGTDDERYPTVLELIRSNRLMPMSPGVPNISELLKGLAPAGRLDIESKGLIVLTQDGVIAKKIIGENSDLQKEYLVRVKGQIKTNGLELLRHGLELDGKALKPAQVEWLNKDQLKFVLTEGKNRQIRRMCELVGLQVTGLKRTRIGNISLGQLKEGYWRVIQNDERF